MAEHKLPLGKQLIEWIAKLGVTLGYHVEKEYLIDKKYSAVDVAWLLEENNKSPLFIFEIESQSTNSMVNNPLKVYAQNNKIFEKPLFFFHIVIKGGSKSSRPDNLELMYGKENYRIYLLKEQKSDELIEDILSQHARVNRELNYVDLYQLVKYEFCLGDIDVPRIFRFAVNLQLSKERIIYSYIVLSLRDEEFFYDLISYIVEETNVEFKNIYLYTYIGEKWLEPIIFSLLCGLSQDSKESFHWSSMLKIWQRGDYLPMLTANGFGLSRDYDEFMLGGAPQLITLCIVLGANKGDFQIELSKVLEDIIDRIGTDWIGINSAIYLLHISAATQQQFLFDKAKQYLLAFKCLSKKDIFFPPSCVSISEGGADECFEKDEEIGMIGSMQEFSQENLKIYKKDKVNTSKMALLALSDESYVFRWNIDLLEGLWSNIPYSV
ncbi:hypothetical protein KTI96_15110 [Acinetobacter bereziniae]|uniref:hypothetical protein n=1 Tax=Acinetobacter bereziniae TaxID=106648 RepID=UPI0021CD4538|nr:hypothetical protein [Acinetobacter bereziniae]MCU4538481.1 hypothetical protein [Acinetobacter bereziniae]